MNLLQNGYSSREGTACTRRFIETKSDLQTDCQRNFKTKYGRDPPLHPLIRTWHKKFMKTGTVFDKGRSGRPRTSKENIDRVRNRVSS